jgi:16S rRNA G966 N2-methylase RsmD
MTKEAKSDIDKKTKRTDKPSSLVDTRVIYCGDNLEQLKKLPGGCVDLIYIDPPFNSNRNYEVFWGEKKEKRSFEDSCTTFLHRSIDVISHETLVFNNSFYF